MKVVILVLISSLLFAQSFAFAEVKLPRVFGSNMVLQRDMPAPIWGWAAANEEISITLSEQDGNAEVIHTDTVKADAGKVIGEVRFLLHPQGAHIHLMLLEVIPLRLRTFFLEKFGFVLDSQICSGVLTHQMTVKQKLLPLSIRISDCSKFPTSHPDYQTWMLTLNGDQLPQIQSDISQLLHTILVDIFTKNLMSQLV